MKNYRMPLIGGNYATSGRQMIVYLGESVHIVLMLVNLSPCFMLFQVKEKLVLFQVNLSPCFCVISGERKTCFVISGESQPLFLCYFR